MSKEMRKPIPFADLKIGHWYRSRFEFEIDGEISDTAVEPPASANRAAPRNKSHRVLVLNKLPAPNGPLEGRAVCLFLTSFGGHLDSSTTITCAFDQLQYMPVNATAATWTSPYRSIPISVQALYGFVNFTIIYLLPIGGGGDKAIVRMREAGRGNADISSPGWAVEYIRRLTIARMTWLLYDAGNEVNWVEVAEGVTAEFGRPEAAAELAVVTGESGESGGISVGTKRLRDNEEDKEEVGKGNSKRQCSHSESPCLDSANDSDEDDDSELDEFDDSDIHDMESCVTNSSSAFPVLLSHALYQLDSDDDDDIDENVNFSLLDALFRPIPL